MAEMKSLTIKGKHYEIVDEKARKAIEQDCAPALLQTAEGVCILAKDSSDKNIRGLKIFGKTTQTTTTGKNRLKNTNSFSLIEVKGVRFSVGLDGRITVNGTATGDIYFDVGTIAYAGNVIFSGCPSDGSDSTYFMDLVNVGVSTTALDYGNSATATLDGTNLTARIRIKSGVTISNKIFCPMIRSASITDNTYEPYTGEQPAPNPEYKQSIYSPNADNEISFRGGNLIPFEYADGDTKVMNGITFTKQEDGSIRVNGIATELAYYSFNTTGNKKPLPSGWLSAYSGIGYGSGIPQIQNDIYVDGVYTLSLQTANKNASIKNLTGKITLGASRIKVDAGVIANNVVIYPMLCASETVLPYEPPINAQTITMGRTLRGLPMASGGTYTDNANQRWVADEVDFERGVHIKRIGDIVLDGSDDEIWYEEVALDNTVMFRIGIADSVNVGNIVGNDFVCSHFTVGQYYNVDAVGAQHTMSQFYFRIAKSSLAEVSLAGFKAWLAANPMTVQYILNTPVVTPLSEDEMTAFKQLHTNYPRTTVVGSADTWTEIKYAVDLMKFLDNKELPDNIDELVAQEVKKYLDENPPSSSNATIGVVDLLANKWVGSGSLYSQVVTIAGVTKNSKVDLSPSVEQLVVFYEKDLSFVTQNDNGVVTVYVIGQKPTNDYSIQVAITEVTR